MIVSKALLNIIDKENDTVFNSCKELDLEIGITTLLDKMLDKVFIDTYKNNGIFKENSLVFDLITKYNMEQINFIELSSEISNMYFSFLKQASDYKKTDIISVLFNHNGNKYYGALFLESKDKYIHNVNMTDEGIANTLVVNTSVLPTTASIYMIINLDTFSLSFRDKKRDINKESKMIIPDLMCNSTREMSIKQSLNIIKRATKEVIENSIDAPQIMASAKAYIVENSNESQTLDVKSLADEAFKDNDVLKEEFQRKIAKFNVPEEIEVPRALAFKEASNHKITTDTGIEIIFPSQYSGNDNFIDFINNPDGTISIEIKNVGKITNK